MDEIGEGNQISESVWYLDLCNGHTNIHVKIRKAEHQNLCISLCVPQKYKNFIP